MITEAEWAESVEPEYKMRWPYPDIRTRDHSYAFRRDGPMRLIQTWFDYPLYERVVRAKALETLNG
jgi:hypothetical protein